jgi:hypothetical protein
MHWIAPSKKENDNAARFSSLSASQGDLRRLGSDERILLHWVRQRPAGPTERARASHWAGVRCWPSDSADTATRASANLGCEATWRDFRSAKDHWSANSAAMLLLLLLLGVMLTIQQAQLAMSGVSNR